MYLKWTIFVKSFEIHDKVTSWILLRKQSSFKIPSQKSIFKAGNSKAINKIFGKCLWRNPHVRKLFSMSEQKICLKYTCKESFFQFTIRCTPFLLYLWLLLKCLLNFWRSQSWKFFPAGSLTQSISCMNQSLQNKKICNMYFFLSLKKKTDISRCLGAHWK